jgi:hypothetical protein
MFAMLLFQGTPLHKNKWIRVLAARVVMNEIDVVKYLEGNAAA